MFEITNLPETTLCFVGRGVNFREVASPEKIVNDQASNNQELKLILGNRCGHSPRAPRFYHRPTIHKPRPSVLEKAIAALEGAYHKPKKFLKSFTYLNPTRRHKRSERREAVLSVAQVLLHYLELSSLKVGFYSNDGKFVPLDLAYVAKKAGITVIRAKRATADLAKAGYLTIARQFDKKDDGTFKGLPSIRKIAASFFIDLGMDIQKLFFAREWKRKKQEKMVAKQSSKKFRDLLARASFLSNQQRVPLLVKNQSDDAHHRAIEKTQALMRQALELHRRNPNRPPGDYLKELQQHNP